MRITLTGADEKTAIDDLVALVADHPNVEIGLLFTATPEGRNRYPSMAWLMKTAEALHGRCAIHVCGGAARAMLAAGALEVLTRHAPRVQVNGIVSVSELAILAQHASTIITQHCPANQALVFADVSNHVLLIDGSGGRGLSPEQWVRPDANKEVGFAGGLGLANLVDELRRILPVAQGMWWVDMEGKLRKDDWFDVQEARAVARLFDALVNGAATSVAKSA